MTRVVNLTFHGVGEAPQALDAGERDVWLTVPRFRRVLDMVDGRRNVRLFFDDGNRSDVDIALPALHERGFLATFAVVSDRLGEAGYLDAADTRELLAAGMTIASHGFAHRPWRRLNAVELEEEVRTARHTLERAVRARIVEAACPFGSYDRGVLACLRQAGFVRVYTSDGGPAVAERWLQARTTIRATYDDRTLDRVLAGRASLARHAKIAVKRLR